MPDRLAGRQSDGEIFLMESLPYTIPAFFQVVNNSNEDDYDDDDDDDNNNNNNNNKQGNLLNHELKLLGYYWLYVA